MSLRHTSVRTILAAVFIPTAAIPGITGRLYQQFAITIAISVLISAFNALTLSPALSALLLKPRPEGRRRGPLARLFEWFNKFFHATTESYINRSNFLLHKAGFSMLLLVGVGITSARAARKRMRYETWYYLHLYTYLAVALAFSHQFATGADFMTNLPARIGGPAWHCSHP